MTLLFETFWFTIGLVLLFKFFYWLDTFEKPDYPQDYMG